MSHKSYAIDGALCITGAISLTYLWVYGMNKLFEAFCQLLHEERQNRLDLSIALKMGKENIEKVMEAYNEKIEKNVKIATDENAHPLESLNAFNALQQDTAVHDYLFYLLEKANEQECPGL